MKESLFRHLEDQIILEELAQKVADQVGRPKTETIEKYAERISKQLCQLDD